jgi:hypothetical protein
MLLDHIYGVGAQISISQSIILKCLHFGGLLCCDTAIHIQHPALHIVAPAYGFVLVSSSFFSLSLSHIVSLFYIIIALFELALYSSRV